MFPSPSQRSPCRRLPALQKNEPEEPGWILGRRWPWATHFVYVTQAPSGGAGIAAKGLAAPQNRQHHHSAPSPRPVGISLPKACSCRSRRAAEGKPNQSAGNTHSTHPSFPIPQNPTCLRPHATLHIFRAVWYHEQHPVGVGGMCGMWDAGHRQTDTHKPMRKQAEEKTRVHFRPVYPLYVAPSINPRSLSRADFRPSAWMASMDGPRKRNKRKNR